MANLNKRTCTKQQQKEDIVNTVRGHLGKIFVVTPKPLGDGAFSSVLKISNKEDTNESFAAKIITKDECVPGSTATMSEHEVGIMKLFDSHLHLVNLLDYYDNNSLYPGSPKVLIMDLLPGGELFDDIVAREQYTEHDAKIVVDQMFQGIEHLHKHRIIHRDLKPENVFIFQKEFIKIGDFGLCIIANDKGRGCGYAGTPEYLPPECYNSSSTYTYNLDVWSLGVILYILLAGHPPFDVTNKGCIYWEDNGMWTRMKNAQDLINRMLTMSPSDRYSIKQCLDHKWTKSLTELERQNSTSSSVGSSDRCQLTSTLQNLKVFNAKRNLKAMQKITIAATNMMQVAGLCSEGHTNTDIAEIRQYRQDGAENWKSKWAHDCSKSHSHSIQPNIKE